MPTFTTEGIIIKRSEFGEADRIITIVTPFRGKIVILAKGVRRITSRRGGHVELLNKVKIQAFLAKGLPILTEVESLKTFPKMKSNFILINYGSHVAELAGRLLAENQVNQGAYRLISAILELLETYPRQIFVRSFEVKLLSELGFWSLSQVEADNNMKQLLNMLETQDWQQIAKLTLTKSQSVELERILRYYMERVIEGTLKSLKMINLSQGRK